MSTLRSIIRHPTMRLYLVGHVLILFGAYLMDVTHSMLPMALASSAALMLMMPLVKQLSARYARVRPDDSHRR